AVRVFEGYAVELGRGHAYRALVGADRVTADGPPVAEGREPTLKHEAQPPKRQARRLVAVAPERQDVIPAVAPAEPRAAFLEDRGDAHRLRRRRAGDGGRGRFPRRATLGPQPGPGQPEALRRLPARAGHQRGLRPLARA